jgi:hypothetical protein
MKMNQKVTMELIGRSDMNKAAFFLEKMTNGKYPQELWLDRFQLWWENNPSISEAQQPKAWVLKDGEEIVGFYSYISTEYSFNEQKIMGHMACSWYVVPAYRQYSLKLLMPFLVIKPPCLLLNTTPAKDTALKIFKFFKVKPIKQLWLNNYYLFPIHGSRLWDLIVIRKFGQGPLGVCLKNAGCLIGPMINLAQKIKMLSIKKKSMSYDIEEINKFTEDYESLWQSFRKGYDLIATRDVKRLNWFFFGSKDLRSHRRVLEIRKNQVLVGYLTVSIAKTSMKNEEYFYYELVDAMIRDESQGAYYAILSKLYELAAKEEKKICFFKATAFDPNIRKYLEKFGQKRETTEQNILMRFSEMRGTIKNEAQSHQAFYFTPLDGDRGFFVE